MGSDKFCLPESGKWELKAKNNCVNLTHPVIFSQDDKSKLNIEGKEMLLTGKVQTEIKDLNLTLNFGGN